jgi:hypothetical protein
MGKAELQRGSAAASALEGATAGTLVLDVGKYALNKNQLLENFLVIIRCGLESNRKNM